MLRWVMSRSIKAPYFKQKQHKKDKQLAAKRARRKIKSPNEEVAEGKAFRKESNSYDISDWSFYSENAKARRK